MSAQLFKSSADLFLRTNFLTNRLLESNDFNSFSRGRWILFELTQSIARISNRSFGG